MDSDDPFSGGNDDGTFVPFTDILFNALLGFAFMVFIAFSLINPTAKSGAVDFKAEMIITVSWPDNWADDIDTYVRDPAGNIVWYNSKEAGLVHLDRDDRGNYRDTITVNGRKIENPLNQETVTVRGIIPGEYVVNIYDYVAVSPKVPVSVKVEKLNPTATVIFYSTIDLDHRGHEETAVRFTLDSDGSVTDVNNRPVSLVQAVRTPNAGNAPGK